MLTALAKKTFDLYTLPARYAYRQTRRNLDMLRQLRGDFMHFKQQSDAVADQLLAQAGRQLGIDPSRLTREQRLHQAQAALANVEYGLSLALDEGLKALLLLTAAENKPLQSPATNRIIEGEYTDVSRSR